MTSAPSALFYLWSRTLLNLLRTRLLRLRQPKYLIGAIMGLGYLYLVFFAPRGTMRDAADAAPRMLPDLSAFIIAVISVFLLIVFIVVWLWRHDRSSLQFTEAEIAHLFPAPIPHNTLVHYSLIRTQVALVFTALFMTLVTSRWQFIPSPLWVRFVGWWLIMGTVTLHVTAVGFTLTRLLDRGITQWQRQLLVAVALVAGFGAMFRFDPHLHLPSPLETAPPEAFSAYLQDQIGSGPLNWLLLPLRVLVKPLVAADALLFVQALVPALLVYGLHYYWVFRSEVPDPDRALAKAAKRAGMLAAFRKGNFRMAAAQLKARADPFSIAGPGSPIMAFLWKNLLSTREYINLRSALTLVVLMVAVNFWLGRNPDLGFIGVILFAVAFMLGSQTLLIGPQFARQDLRSDLENADVIKTYPLEGWQIVLGELLAPVVILTGILWLCLLQIGLGFHPPRMTWLTPEVRWVAGISLALVLPFLCAVLLLVANTAAVLFPAWMKPAGAQGSQGLDVAGQRLLFFAGQWLVMLAALLPGLLFGLVVYVPGEWLLGIYALLPAALVTALVLAGEIAWGINWLGERFDAYDLTA